MTGALSPDSWDDIAPARSVWLITLADLALLLIGFFVLLQAHREADRTRLLAGLRSGFGVEAPAPVDPMAVARARVDGYAPGSAYADLTATISWARDVARDKRTVITITGSTAPEGDTDPRTGSAAILAADRARAAAAALVAEGAVSPERLILRVAPGNRRAVTLSVGFAGDPESEAGDQQ
ncbi:MULTISPECIES: OmpA family protein [unclassified Sphingomonas]|uniref:OmpA family protein n=1 Tax=unclassified Sphingomonas TaxID=196159 RepID=UPI002150D67D|nr:MULTISPECIES: flagellar motor protein MotB [unclassified Sphingomonas]MCR5870505.1 flagellar motor protein MotB [Sphingomonas sp. J344]UUY01149.1 flagellar motor protein MotB [Sphingomonas sp. J315]